MRMERLNELAVKILTFLETDTDIYVEISHNLRHDIDYDVAEWHFEDREYTLDIIAKMISEAIE